jgi:predicted anti-sigma-YlaC factor YlaD
MGDAMDKRGGDMVKRLLGPTEPEMLCDECFEKLDEYVDLELRGAAADRQLPGMRPHLNGCPACREEYDSLRELAQADSDSH